MSLRNIREAIVASADVRAAVAFHEAAFGLQVLDGDPDTAEGVLLGVPGSPGGRLRLVPTSAPVDGVAAVWDTGPRLLGMYSRDLERTAAAIDAAGGAARTPTTYPYGAASLSELVARGADGVWWTIPLAVPGAHRPSPALADDASRPHSELHTAVLVVESSDHDAAVGFFEALGLHTIFDGTMTGEPFDQLVGMPEEAALRLAFMAGADAAPARLEIMSFTGVPAVDRTADAVGIRRLVFVADDVAATRETLADLGAEQLPDGAFRGPVGVEIELVDAPGGNE